MNKKIYTFIFAVFIMYVFDAFTNTYIVLREFYENRMVKNAGFCNAQGYGFIKKIISQFPEVSPNVAVKNYLDFPSASGYFFDYKANASDNYLILLNPKKKDLDEYINKNFTNIYSEDRCYLLKKND